MPTLHPLAVSVLGLYAGYHYFQRAPRRITPLAPEAIISPAEGRIIHIEQATTSTIAFFKKDVLNVLQVAEIAPPFKVVVIELNLFNVHVQRAPIAGQVVAQRYYPGQFANAMYGADRAHLANSNEKMLTIIANETTAVAVVQVAGLVATRISSCVQPAAVVPKGSLIGRITFGSQVVLVLRDHAQLAVKVGDVVTDGETVIATVARPFRS